MIEQSAFEELAERLRELILVNDRGGLEALLGPLEEADRVRLAPVAVAEFDAARRRHDRMLYQPGQPLSLDTAHQWSQRATAAAIAWLGTGDLADLPPAPEPGDDDFDRGHEFEYAFGAEETFRILLDRRPVWLARLAERFFAGYRWDLGWRLVLAGAVPRSSGPAYLRSMARNASWGPRPGLAAMVRRDPGLLADLRALLELPDGWQLIVQSEATALRGEAWPRWLPVLIEHFRSGDPVREHFLDRLMEWMSGDLLGHDVRTLVGFLDRLWPTPQELAARRELLTRMAANSAPFVVAYAVPLLDQLSRAGFIRVDELIEAMLPALATAQSETALAAMEAVAAAQCRGGEVPRALRAYATAADHPDPQVQLAAAQQVLTQRLQYPDLTADVLRRLSPAAAEQLTQLLPECLHPLLLLHPPQPPDTPPTTP